MPLCTVGQFCRSVPRMEQKLGARNGVQRFFVCSLCIAITCRHPPSFDRAGNSLHAGNYHVPTKCCVSLWLVQDSSTSSCPKARCVLCSSSVYSTQGSGQVSQHVYTPSVQLLCCTKEVQEGITAQPVLLMTLQGSCISGSFNPFTGRVPPCVLVCK